MFPRVILGWYCVANGSQFNVKYIVTDVFWNLMKMYEREWVNERMRDWVREYGVQSFFFILRERPLQHCLIRAIKMACRWQVFLNGCFPLSIALIDTTIFINYKHVQISLKLPNSNFGSSFPFQFSVWVRNFYLSLSSCVCVSEGKMIIVFHHNFQTLSHRKISCRNIEIRNDKWRIEFYWFQIH